MHAITTKVLFALALSVCAFDALADTPPPDPTYHTVYGATDWRELVPEKAAEYKNYRVIVLSNPNYTDDEKAAKIARKYAEIRDAVRASRQSVYADVSEVVGIGNSATNGSGNGPVTVGAKCAGAAKPQMFTRPEWARGAYRSGTMPANADVLTSGNPVDPTGIVIDNGDRVCAIKLKQSGQGRKVAYSQATFHIRPEQIKTIVDAEVLSMMYAISGTPI